MATHLSQQRYSAVIGNEGQIFLRGVLDESSDLKQTLDLIQERFKSHPQDMIQLDFSQLSSGSWNGFQKLDQLLAKCPYPFHLRHVSFDIFRYVSLLPELRKAKLGEIELSVVAKGKQKEEKIQLSGQDLEASHQQSNQESRFVSVGGQQLIGKHSFIFGDRNQKKDEKPQIKSEFDFWYDYIAFADVTLALSEDLAKSIAISMIRLSTELALEYCSQKTAFEVAGKLESSIWAQEAEAEAKSLAERAKDSESIYGQIICEIRHNVKQLEAIQRRLHTMENQTHAEWLQVVSEIRPIKDQLSNIVRRIEDGGTETFSLLISIPGKKTFDESFQKLAEPSPEKLAAIREAFSIMDPLSEDDWEQTKDAIFERTNDIEQAVSNLIILTQGFDLLRQIIEHRIHEFEHILQYIDRGAPESERASFEETLHDQIRKKLVTDQEKHSLDALIPEAREEDAELVHKPGEVLLF